MALLPRFFFRRLAILMAATASITATSYALAQSPGRMDHMHMAAADPGERQFLSDNQAAMSKMSSGMAVDPTGDVDRDFVAMMVPHHQGAIDMARAELKYGHNEVLRRLAGSIIGKQGREISIMRHAIGSNSQSKISTSPKHAAASAQ